MVNNMHLVPNPGKHVFLVNLGAAIKQQRVSDKISRSRFGKLTGLTVFKVDQLESGKLDIDIQLVLFITSALSVTPSAFFEIAESM